MMNAPWFDPSFAWIPGTAFGLLGGLFGGCFGILIPLSHAEKRLVGIRTIKTAYFLLLGSSVVMLLAGGLALIAKQPFAIWYGLALPGAIGLIVFASLSFLVFRLPKQLESEWNKHDG